VEGGGRIRPGRISDKALDPQVSKILWATKMKSPEKETEPEEPGNKRAQRSYKKSCQQDSSEV
jgi:hypothetical protein